MGNGEAVAGIGLGTFVAWSIFGAISLGMWGCPHYHVWQQKLQGEAELARAGQNRQIEVQEAEAKAAAAKELANAEIARARGVAEANRIIGESLKGNESYLRYLWINGMQDNDVQVIYIPTEAGLPILEAGHAPSR
jgi:predicted aminopeptidase